MSAPNLDIPKLTPQQKQAIANEYLESLEPGVLPLPIFRQLARLGVLSTVEVGLVRPSEQNENGTELVLTPRPSTDEYWPGEWHIPGSAIRADDPVKHEHDHEAVISRVMDEVGGDIRIIGEPKEVDMVRRKGQRGSELTLRLLAEVEGEPGNGRFFDAARVLRQPPEAGLLESHAVAIAKVAEAYESLRAES